MKLVLSKKKWNIPVATVPNGEPVQLHLRIEDIQVLMSNDWRLYSVDFHDGNFFNFQSITFHFLKLRVIQRGYQFMEFDR